MLPKSLFPVVFSGGLDQKTDYKLRIPGKFDKLENSVRRKAGRVEKRSGLTAYTAPPAQTYTQLIDFDDSPTLMSDDEPAVYSESSTTWSKTGGTVLPTVSWSLDHVFANTGIQHEPSCAVGGGVICCVFSNNTDTNVYYAILDEETHVILKSGPISASASSQTRPRVEYIGSNFVACYIEGSGDLKAVSISTAGVVGTVHTVISTAANALNDACLDTCVFNSLVYYAVSNDGKGISVGAIDSTGTGQFSPFYSDTSATTVSEGAIAIAANATYGAIYVFYYDSNTSTNITGRAFLASDFATKSSTFTIESVSNVINISACFSSDDGTCNVYYEVGHPSTYSVCKNQIIKTNSFTSTWAGSGTITPGTASTFLRSVGMFSKPILVDGVAHLLVAYGSSLQSAYYLVDENGTVKSQIALGYAGGLLKRTRNVTAMPAALSAMVLDSGNNLVLPIQYVGHAEINSLGELGIDQMGLRLTTLTISDTSPRNFAKLGNTAIFAGGIPTVFDGYSNIEYGFFTYPENVLGISVDPGTALRSAGVYSYVVIYEWYDKKGNRYQSAPSEPYTVEQAGTEDLSLSVPTLRLGTASKLEDIKIVVYATAVDAPGVYYRYSLYSNDPTVDTVDATMNSETNTFREVLYTSSNILDNTMLPACTTVHKHRDRLWANNSSRSVVTYSREFQSGEPVQFSDLLEIQVPEEGGDVTAFASVDDKLVIFKARQAYFIYGQGPSDAGLQNDFPLPQLILKDVGAVSQQLVVEGPFGCIFLSERGFYSLSGGLSLKYIGAPVEDTAASLTFTSATLLADISEVRFTTEEGTGLVYNYEFDQWSTFTNYAAIDSCYSNGTYVLLRSDGTLHKEVEGTYLDGVTPYTMTIETSWLSLHQIQGFQRIYRMLLLGDLIDDFTCSIKIAYDFEPTYNETITFLTSDVLDSDVFQVDAYPARQKCEAIKLQISDGAAEGSLSLTAMSCILGRKTGGYRLPTAKKVGSL